MNIVEKLNLPPFEPIEYEEAHAFNYWRDYYGALDIVKEYCGLKSTTKVRNFSWYHGVFPPGYNTLSILTNNLYDKNKVYFVTDNEQKEVLVKNGYIKTFCIGLPIIYTPIPKVNRIKDSLLIMPSHSLVGCETYNIDQRGLFIDEIIKSNQFQVYNILACLHSNDIKNNFWVNELNERRIAYIEGAKNNDKNAYKRQVALFSQFEYMITNDFGSHVMYALYLGVKVAILNFPIELKALEEEVNQRIFPETGMSFEDLETLKKEKLISLFTNLTEAKQNFEIGNYYVGLEHKKSPSELKKLFGFSFYGKIFWMFQKIKDILYVFKSML
jgi:hypothetical protein